MKLGRWSTTAGSNNQTPPDGWPEGMAPSAVNDAAREMMASIRTVFNDPQYFDQDLTPTFINTTSFSVAGDQTSAIHAGRRLKIFDATAGVATVIYATVLTASFTAVTTISVSADGGQLSSSLSSFAIAILSNTNNSLPRGVAQFSASALGTENLTVAGTMSVSGASVLKGALSVGGAVNFAGTLSISGTAVAANIAKVWGFFFLSAGGLANGASFNINSISRSATGTVKMTFTTALLDATYAPLISTYGGGATTSPSNLSREASTCKFTIRNNNNSAVDEVFFSIACYR